MHKLLIATHNKGKVHEFSEFLADLSVKLLSLSDVNITQDVEEDGQTYQENSQKKALYYSKLANLPAIADDGGLEIAALGGAPGIRSRRWLGHESSDEELIEHMKKVADQLPDTNRNAAFITVVSLALPNGNVWSVKGEVKGIIAKQPLMKHLEGYPYRSFFYIPEINKYYHESDLPPSEMKTYNHRFKAVMELKPVIYKALNL
jgi:XTP/dITP diphosphohydrolase